MIKASAPGRVNLIGEHTDYNGGLVLPTPIPQRTHVELTPRSDDVVTVWSDELAMSREFRLGHEARTGTWVDYIQGCTEAARRAGYQLHGADVRITSEVPLGSGLSSSAALEVALLRAFREAYALDLDDVALALLGQRAENDLVGAPVGAMDQLAVSVGTPGAALFIDMRTLQSRRIPLPDADLLVIASGIQHDHAAGDYRTRRAECERAASLLGVATLSDLGSDDLARAMRLPEPLGRRVRHVVTENRRVRAAVEAIAIGDLPRLGALFHESHASMRDDYEVSIMAIDTLVEIARTQRDVYGARLTGGGFGGSIVALARRGTGGAAAQAIVQAYAAAGYSGQILVAGEVPCDRS